MICFEALFPDLAALEEGAFLFNPTNDVRVGVGADQQAAMAVFRAVENGVSLLRVANRGPSLLVDPMGRVLEHAVGWGAPVWEVDAPLPGTPFRRMARAWAGFLPARSCGEGPLAWICLAVALYARIRT